MKDYNEFVEKFKPKKTTDDCYTPPEIYEKVKNWAIKEYDIRKEIIRPFYPGGDYESEDYTDKVVIDNPPFSILSKIVKFYLERKIPFFLFAPTLTAFNNVRYGLGCIIIKRYITYENGAKVLTCFITNLETDIRTSLELSDLLFERKPKRKRYLYPENLITATMLNQILNKGIDFRIPLEKRSYINKLESQGKCTIFGGGYLISDDLAKEKMKYYSNNNYSLVFDLSESEKECIKQLNGNKKD